MWVTKVLSISLYLSLSLSEVVAKISAHIKALAVNTVCTVLCPSLHLTNSIINMDGKLLLYIIKYICSVKSRPLEN